MIMELNKNFKTLSDDEMKQVQGGLYRKPFEKQTDYNPIEKTSGVLEKTNLEQ